MSMVLASPRSNVDEFRRAHGIVQFGLDIIPDDQGWRSYRLCVQRDRHYTIKFKPGESPRLMSGFTPCDRDKCSEGKVIEVSDPHFLYSVGVYQRLPKEKVLVVEAYGAYRTFEGGQIIDPIELQRGKLLENGQSMQFERRLDRSINLAPDRRFNRKIISTITDKVTNVGGRAVVSNNEAELRAEEAELYREINERYAKQQADRQARRRDFAREVAQFLKREHGFTHEQVGKLFELAGPGQCRSAVAAARWAKETSRPVSDYELEWRYGLGVNVARIVRAAEYIVEIGGIPNDRK